MAKNKVQRKEIIIATFVLIGFVAISLVCVYYVFDPLRLQPTTVSQAFIKSLINRNKTKAYRLSSPDLWDDIDEWYMKEANGPTECPLIATINEDYFGAGVCSGGRNDTTVSCSWWQICRPINYEFKITDVVVIRKGVSWQVISFGPICESWDYECLY